ncbi:hypothetical protein ILUMI_03627 [Ignelater luminosus]|uniref:Hexosyltransferase n=1 Tax=Ignelater luminosus TaxID=2038154 RepID=A0A8K0DB73_IGNLU|nr:hypothetical protein ILUMI_03627 [Ignelater luminosus]
MKLSSSKNDLSPFDNIKEHFIKRKKKIKDLSGTNLLNTTLGLHVFESSANNNFVADLTLAVSPKIISQVNNSNVSYKLCRDSGKNLQLFVAVISAPSHERARLAVRQTWGHFAARRDISIAFIVGSSTNAVYNRKLKREEYMYQDIIRGKFLDSYRDSTAKAISMLKWINTYCFKATFVLKVNDNIFINIPRLLTFISTRNPEQRAIYGRLAIKFRRQRYERILEYKPTVFPDFVIGPTYLFPTGISKDLYFAAINHAYVKSDDVFLTGIVANDLQIERIHVPEFFNRYLVLTSCNIERIVSVRVVNESAQFDLWTKLFKDHTKC